MSVVIAEGEVSVKADGKHVSRDIARDIDNNNGPLQKSGGLLGGRISTGIGGAMAGMGRVVAGALVAVTAGLAIGVGAIITNGVKFQSAMQSYEAAFTPLLGGADAAKATLLDLSRLGASTPFELTDLAGASQTLLAFGQDSATLIPTLNMLGDISQGNSEKLSGLALVFGQVQSNGKLMGQDLLQMINQGFNPLQVISDKTGESMLSLRDRMSAGKISFAEVQQAMQWATEEGGMFYGAMALGAKTLSGAWSTMQDGANFLSGAIVGNLTPALTNILNLGINPLLGGLFDLVSGVDGAQATVDSASSALLSSITAIGPVITDMAANLGTVFEAVAPSLAAALGSIVTSLITILPSVIGLAGQLIGSILSAIIDNGPQLVAAAVPVILGFVTGLLGQLPALIGAGVLMLIALVNGIVDSLPTLIPAVVTALVDSLVTLLNPANLTALLKGGLALITGLVTGLITALPMLLDTLPQIIAGIVGFISGDGIVMLIEAGVDLFLGLVGALPMIIEGLVSAIPVIITGLVTATASATPKLIMAGLKLFIGLIGALPQIIISLVNAVPKIITGIVKAFSDPKVIAQFAKAGGDLIRGLWKGISDLGAWIWSKISGFASGIVDQVKGFIGIRSPSTVFAYLGKMLGTGLANGIVATAGLVGAAASGIGRAARAGLGFMGVTVTGPSDGTGAGGPPDFPGAPGGGGIGGGGFPGNAPVGSSGGDVYIGNVTLDAHNVKDFTDVVDMVGALPQVARTGRGKRG